MLRRIGYFALAALAYSSTSFADVRIFGNASDMTISGAPAKTLFDQMKNIRAQQSRQGIRVKISRDIACADKYVDSQAKRVVSEFRCVIPIKDIRNGIVK